MNDAKRKVRYAVYDTVNHEILAANYLVPGQAYNHATMDYWKPVGIVTVLTINDEIIGECNRRGSLLKIQKHTFNKTIWCDAKVRATERLQSNK